MEERFCGAAVWCVSEGANYWMLLLILLLLVFINTCVLTVFQILAPYKVSRPSILQLTPNKDAVITDISNTYTYSLCLSPTINIWLGILLSPLISILLFGLHISLHTRHVSTKYSECRQINNATYITSLSLVILICVAMSVRVPSTLQLIVSVTTSLTFITVIAILFIGRLYE
ncbi:hypothetical protein BC829DRAFT_385290, partial [Chytridium lagenaria]